MSSTQNNDWTQLPTAKYNVISAHWKNDSLILGSKTPDFTGLIAIELKPNTPNEPVILAGSLPGYRDGPLTSAQFSDPVSICQGMNDGLLVADSECHTIRLVDASKVETFLGSGQPGFQDGLDNVTLSYPNLVAQTASHVIIQDGARPGALRIYNLNTRQTTTIGAPQRIGRAFPIEDDAFGLVSSGYVHQLSFHPQDQQPQIAPFFVTPTPLTDAFRSRLSPSLFYVKNYRIYCYATDSESISPLSYLSNGRGNITVQANHAGRVVAITSEGVFLYAPQPYRAPSNSNIEYSSSYSANVQNSGTSSPFGNPSIPVTTGSSNLGTMSPSSSFGSFSGMGAQGSTTPPPSNMSQPGYVRANSGPGMPSGGPGNVPSGYSSPQVAHSSFEQPSSQYNNMGTNYNTMAPSGANPSGSNTGYPPNSNNNNNQSFGQNSRPNSGQLGGQQNNMPFQPTPSGYPPTSTSNPGFDSPGSPFGAPPMQNLPSGTFDMTPSQSPVQTRMNPQVGYPPSVGTNVATPPSPYPPASDASRFAPVSPGFVPPSAFPPTQPSFGFPPGSPAQSPMMMPTATAIPMSQLNISPAYLPVGTTTTNIIPANTTVVHTTVAHTPASAQGRFWEWEADLVNHKFARYDASVSDAIDAAYHSGASKAHVNLGGRPYEIDLTSPAPRQFLASDHSKSRRVKAPHGYTLPAPR